MSKSRTALQGGMNEVIPPEHLDADQAILIQNMRMERSGSWKAVRVPREAQQSITQLSEWAWEWKPVYLPAGCIEDTVYVTWDNLGQLYLVYKKSTGYYTTAVINSGTTVASLRVASDAQQFVFVDGRLNSGARRITIDDQGVIHCRKFGTEQPITMPIITKIENERFQNGQGTGMPVGSILLYSYCIVNEYGERSNPSPVAVCDTASWYAKGELLAPDYVYNPDNQGSITRVSIECSIPIPEEAKRLELYRASAEYSEGIAPLDTMKLVASKTLDNVSSVVITDASFLSMQEIDYEANTAPAGDDIALESGTLFIANAVSDRLFPVTASKIWQIVLENKNGLNYVNRWISIDIRDKRCAVEGVSKFADLDKAEDLFTNKYVLYDSDMVTPLKAMGINNTAGAFIDIYPMISALSGTKSWVLMHLQIPYIPANSDKTIYLVESTEFSTVYDTVPHPIAIDRAEVSHIASLYDGMIDNPVRDENCLVAVGRIRSGAINTDSWEEARGNKANALWARLDAATEINETPVGGIIIHDDSYTGDVANSTDNQIMAEGEASSPYSAITAQEYDFMESMPAKDDGYFCVHGYAQQAEDLDRSLFAINFKETTTGRRQLKCWFTHKNTAGGLTFTASIWDDDTPASLDDITHVIDHYTEDPITFYVFLSWKRTRTASSGDATETSLAFGVMIQLADKKYWMFDTLEHGASLKRRYSPQLKLFPSDITNTGFWYFNNGEYIDSEYEAFALHKFATHFPVEAIGFRNEIIPVGGIKYIVNQNVTVEAVSMANEKKPGRIRWSLGGSVPHLYERNIQEEIIGIIPIRSFMPTDEHNTILVFLDKRVIRMPLVGDNKEASVVYTEIEGIGLQDRDSIARTDDGIVWSERTGIYYLTASGLKSISLSRIIPGTYKAAFNHRDREIFFINSAGVARIYSLDWDNWSIRDYGITAKRFIEYAGLWCLIGTSGVYELTPADDDTTLVPKILTRKMALPRGGKIRRIALHSAAGTVKAYIYNHRLSGGYTSSPIYSLSGDDPKAIPGLSGDYVQFEIVTDEIKSLEIEDNSNG